ncbi:Sulfotransferase [Sulfidibacter corallicola]|uniref:Sulfotransferase n=1 Tax=Sulfidibacter corallicola TaxID=2818388 RepID=A0A8A4TU88_SULCO|nr:sulfotransferase [Sulfidibacter corallicola]QTD50095.1 sulfotransferase [Sulfidibacter corallicola]
MNEATCDLHPVFVLCSPRCGSTLLRVMLAGHPGLFAPPELHLLPYRTMAERANTPGMSEFMGLGLVKALTVLSDTSMKTAQKELRAWERDDRSIPDVYHALTTAAAPRMLVDKTPTYAEHLEHLERAGAWFPKARFIHLIRHPLAVMDSIMRLNRKPMVRDFVFRGEVDSWRAAETIWVRHNRNSARFLATVAPDRQTTIRYEDLVTRPEAMMRAVCEMLGLTFDRGMLDPYQPGRMTEGIAIGDVNFRNHKGVDPALAEAWRDVRLPHPLSDEAQALAAAYDYPVPVATAQ